MFCYSQNKEIILKINNKNNEIINDVNIITALDNLLIEQNSMTGLYHLNGVNDSIELLNIYLYKDNYIPISDILSLKESSNMFDFSMDESTVLDNIIIDYGKPIVESNKITYRVNNKLLLKNSDAHDALRLIPFVFQRIENNSTTYRYKNNEVFIFINGSIDNNNIIIPDAELIEKIEFYPYGNSYYKEGTLPLINIILKSRELTNRSTVFIKTSPLLNDNLLSYNFLYSKRKTSFSLPFTIFQSKYISKLDINNNYNTDSNYKLDQFREDISSSLRPTLNIKFNENNSLITSGYLGLGSKENYQEKSSLDNFHFDSKIKNDDYDTFLSTTYEHQAKNTIFSARGFWRYSSNEFKWNDKLTNDNHTSIKRYYLGDINIRRPDFIWNNYSLDYKVGYTLTYTDNSVEGSSSNYNMFNSTNIFYAGSVIKLNDYISSDIYLSYNLVNRSNYKKNFFIPSFAVNYKTDNGHLFSLSFKDDYILPNEKFTNENIDYTSNNNQVLGSRYLEGYKKKNLSLSFTSTIYDIDYSLIASYKVSNNEIITVPSIIDNSLLFEFRNSRSKFHKVNLGFDISKSFLNNKLYTQFETMLHLNDLNYLDDENNLTRVKSVNFSYDLYLKFLLNSKSSIELSSYWNSNNNELFHSYSSNYPMISLSYSKNILKNLMLKFEAYSPLISNREKNYLNTLNQSIKSSSYDFNNLKFISIQLRYSIGNSKIRYVKSSSDSVIYEN